MASAGLQTIASRGEGIDELMAAIDSHRSHLEANGELHVRRIDRARAEIEAIAVAAFRTRMTTGGAASSSGRPGVSGGCWRD